VLSHIASKFTGAKIRNFDAKLFNKDRLAEYTAGIARVYDLYEEVRVCGFIDGTCDGVARLSYGGYNGDGQRALYSGTFASVIA